jgi:hypothetical protein
MRSLFALSVAWLTACSASGAGGTGGGTTGMGGGTAGVGGGTAGGGGGAAGSGGGVAGSGGGAAGSGGATGAGTQVGVIALSRLCLLDGGNCSNDGYTYFYASVDGGCVWTMVSGCQVFDCHYIGIKPDYASAGVVTIDGTQFDGGPITFDDHGDGGYPNFASYFAIDPPPLWSGGETLTVTATGLTVPAFSGKTVRAPHDLSLTGPTCPGGWCGNFSRSQPFTVAWSGGAGSEATVKLSSYTPANWQAVVVCNLPSSPGTIPAAAMAHLWASSDAGSIDGGYNAALLVSPSNTTTFKSGTFDISFSATGRGEGGNLNIIY